MTRPLPTTPWRPPAPPAARYPPGTGHGCLPWVAPSAEPDRRRLTDAQGRIHIVSAIELAATFPADGEPWLEAAHRHRRAVAEAYALMCLRYGDALLTTPALTTAVGEHARAMVLSLTRRGATIPGMTPGELAAYAAARPLQATVWTALADRRAVQAQLS